MVIPDGYLLDPASHQCLIEFCQMCSLLGNEILKIIDSLYLLVSCGSIDGGLLAEFPESENLISNLVVDFFALGFLDELLLQLRKPILNAVR